MSSAHGAFFGARKESHLKMRKRFGYGNGANYTGMSHPSTSRKEMFPNRVNTVGLKCYPAASAASCV